MRTINFEKTVRQILETAGVEINGRQPWDIHVHNSEFYKRVVTQRTLGLGESYMEGWWTCEAIDQLFDRLVRAELHRTVKLPLDLKVSILLGQYLNRQKRSRSLRVVKDHYNAKSSVLLSFLDDYKQYSCGYFEDTDDLNTAQRKKLNLICRKLSLSTEDHVLDIGCGYGGFARYAAEHYGCKVTGITPSKSQIKYAKAWNRDLNVAFYDSYYQEVKGDFTKVVSVGMFEHVGHKNYRTFMKKVYDCLKDDGIFLLHTMGGNISVFTNDPWVDKYIFPNGMLPSVQQIAKAAEEFFVIEDFHNFGSYYDNTLMAWHKNFLKNFHKIKNQLDETIFRMWEYYFLHFAGTFRGRKIQLWQFVFSKKGIPGGYGSIR